MKETPLLFKGDMVRGLLRQEHPKTQTRRLAKFKPHLAGDEINFDCSAVQIGHVCTGSVASGWCLYSKRGACWNQITRGLHSPYGHKGDRIWVKETWHPHPSCHGPASYRATWPLDDDPPDGGWKSAMFMPHKAARIELELTEEPRIERACNISALDCLEEGYRVATDNRPNPQEPHEWYEQLFKEINGPAAWISWVWVLTFKRIKP